MDIFSMPVERLDASHIQALVENKLREGTDLEFKAALATKDGRDDRWITHGDNVGDEAKSDLVKELVGFANTGGGTLILGIAEQDSRAASVKSLPCIVDLAGRLKMACRDLIEPAIPQMKVLGIPLSPDGSGVVVFRVAGQSPMGPHRHRKTKEFYIRRNDDTVPMTVDEIRRYSIDLQSRMTSIETNFHANAEALFEQVRTESVNQRCFALSCHLIPVTPIYVPDIFQFVRHKLNFAALDVNHNGKKIGDAQVPGGSIDWQPIVRGVLGRISGWDDNIRIKATMRENGEIQITWIEIGEAQINKPKIFMSWVIGVLANGILFADLLKRRSNFNDAQYLARFSFFAKVVTESFELKGYDNGNGFGGLGVVPNQSYVFPVLPISSRISYSDVCATLDKDFCDHCGYKGEQSKLIFDFEPAFQRLDNAFIV